MLGVVALIGVAQGAAPSPSPPTPSALATSPFGAIGAIERSRKNDPAMLGKYLASSDTSVAARAALAVGRLGNPAGNRMLLAILADSSKPEVVRAAAAFALGLLKSADSLNALIDATRRAPAPIAAMAANALGRIGGSVAVGALTPLLNHPDSTVRTQAAVALGTAAIPGASGMDLAHRRVAGDALASNVFTERDQEVRWREAWALGRAYYQIEGPALRRMLTDGQELVRLYAVAGLGRLGDRSYALPVRLDANDSSWRVRIEVRNALLRLHDPTRVTIKMPAVPAWDLATPLPLASAAPFGDHPQVAIVTSKGVVVLELFPDVAPYSVDNFLSLVDRGFYNNLQYFRVIEDFVVQGGDPKNSGNGGPGYAIAAELNPIEQLTGIISYGLDYDPRANTPELDSAGSQYYITQSPQLHLDEAFTVFGRVVKGMAVVDALVPHAIGENAHADIAKQVYRCQPVTSQTADVEDKLRSAEIGYDAQ